MAHDPPRWLATGETMTVDFPRLGALANPVVDAPGALDRD
jgi:hypothetical protein